MTCRTAINAHERELRAVAVALRWESCYTPPPPRRHPRERLLSAFGFVWMMGALALLIIGLMVASWAVS